MAGYAVVRWQGTQSCDGSVCVSVERAGTSCSTDIGFTYACGQATPCTVHRVWTKKTNRSPRAGRARRCHARFGAQPCEPFLSHSALPPPQVGVDVDIVARVVYDRRRRVRHSRDTQAARLGGLGGLGGDDDGGGVDGTPRRLGVLGAAAAKVAAQRG